MYGYRYKTYTKKYIHFPSKQQREIFYATSFTIFVRQSQVVEAFRSKLTCHPSFVVRSYQENDFRNLNRFFKETIMYAHDSSLEAPEVNSSPCFRPTAIDKCLTFILNNIIIIVVISIIIMFTH